MKLFQGVFGGGSLLGPAHLEIALPLRQLRRNAVLSIEQVQRMQLKIEKLGLAHRAICRLYHKRWKDQCECPDEWNSRPRRGGDRQLEHLARAPPVGMGRVGPVRLGWRQKNARGVQVRSP